MKTTGFRSVDLSSIQKMVAQLRVNQYQLPIKGQKSSAFRMRFTGPYRQTLNLLEELERTNTFMTLQQLQDLEQAIQKQIHDLERLRSSQAQAHRQTLTNILQQIIAIEDQYENIIARLREKLQPSEDPATQAFFERLDYLHTEQASIWAKIINILLPKLEKAVAKAQQLRGRSGNRLALFLINQIILQLSALHESIRQMKKNLESSLESAYALPKKTNAAAGEDQSQKDLDDLLQRFLHQDCLQFISEFYSEICTKSHFHSLASQFKHLFSPSMRLIENKGEFVAEIEAFFNTACLLYPNDTSLIRLKQKFERLQALNRYALDQCTVKRIEYPHRQEIPAAHAPLRPANQISHFVDAYRDINQPEDEIAGSYPSIVRSISSAQHLICIGGWEINLELDYLHPEYSEEQHKQSKNTLGHLLIRKAKENPDMVIAIKVWAQVFKSRVPHHFNAIPYLDKIAREEGLVNGLADIPNFQFYAVHHSGLFNSHHAKVIIADIPVAMTDGQTERKLTAFYGGLDLAADRMDDCQHQKHRQVNQYGWHDIHQQITGPVVGDLLNDFYSRWRRGSSATWGLFDRCTQDVPGLALFTRFMKNLAYTKLIDYKNCAPEGAIWQAQLLRSTTRHHHHDWLGPNDHEKSIAMAYQKAIHNAEHCIEMETQYLIGGPGVNSDPLLAKANPIPQAIVDKIVAKSLANQDFHVFIILPMLPNTDCQIGDFSMDSLRVLQWKTMKWMMTEIERRTGKPFWHYISFNFLAQWEGKTAEYDSLIQQEGVSRQTLISKSQRSPVYVHSKYLTVDNRFMICGSANANERSLNARSGDTEMAIFSRPMPGKEEACKQAIMQQRREEYQRLLGEKFIQDYPDCLEHPERYANQRRQLALTNLGKFYADEQAQNVDPDATPLCTWPWTYSSTTGQVGKMQKGFATLPDTPQDKKDKKRYGWFLERSKRADFLAALGLRPAN